MRSRERPVLPRFDGVLKTQPKATEIKVTFVQWGGGGEAQRTVFERLSVGCVGILPGVSPQERRGAGVPVGITQSTGNSVKWAQHSLPVHSQVLGMDSPLPSVPGK